MLPVDRIRYHLIEARRRHKDKRLDTAVTALLADAMIEERRNTGAATEADLERRYGFTAEEVKAHARVALDRATERFVRAGAVDPATC
ncbi:MAG: hypothetical protein KDK07_08105 [Bauldia sp.]|nr:hypothetical protein [Bauldia sp.]